VIEGNIQHLFERNRKYDIIMTCSVLHHIPDIAEFLARVRELHATGGIFLHLQDPNGDYLNDAALNQRIAELSAFRRPSLPTWVRRFNPRRIAARVRRTLGGHRDETYLDRVNNELIDTGVIKKAMAPPDIWRVTDIHVHDEQGISIERLRSLLVDYRLVSSRSYAFFGAMSSDLPGPFRQREQQLTDRKAPNGLEIAGLWKLESSF
jgi:hypothetical protein